MYKATREFIKARQPHAKFTVEVITGVRKIGGGIDGKCYSNAHNQINADEGIQIVSGWLVNKYDKKANLTAIIQHWWNVDKNGFFDTTPNVSDHFEYVIDMDLAAYVSEHDDKIANYVAYSLMLKNGVFSVVDMNEHDVLNLPIESLTTEFLYKRGT
jgi:hypothetical protein